MNFCNIKKHLFEISLILVLFLTLFVSNNYTKIVVAIVLLVYMLIALKFMQRKKLIESNSKKVTLVMLITGIFYVAFYYVIGLYTGYYEATIKLGIWAICRYILPFTIIIISSETIRFTLISQEKKHSKLIAFAIMVFVDIILYAQIYDLSVLNDFLIVIGYILFSSISSNLLYNYISDRFGAKPIIVYRLITILYLYIIPITPNVYTFFRVAMRIIMPYIIYIILERNFTKDNFKLALKNKKVGIISTLIMVVLSIMLVMLISCNFKYGILIVGSNSMTGSISKGDAVIFEAYNGQKLEEGQIIIFNKDNVKTIHRIESIKIKDGEEIYYTKGDNNEQTDDGYRTGKDIIGVVKFKIIYIGWPTIMLNDFFDNI